MASNIHAQLDPATFQRLGERAEQLHVPIAVVTRLAISEYLDRDNTPPAPPTQQLYVARILCDELLQVLSREPSG
jgi:hypothetical protein